MSRAVDTEHFRQLEEGIWRNGPDWRGQALAGRFRRVLQFRPTSTTANTCSRRATPMSKSAFPFEHFDAEPLTDDVVLVTYENVVTREGRPERARRSSVWVLDGDQWRLRFMQATTLED